MVASASLARFGALAETLSGNPGIGEQVIKEVCDGGTLAPPAGAITISTLDVERRAFDVQLDE